jgi:hypothetical protein
MQISYTDMTHFKKIKVTKFGGLVTVGGRRMWEKGIGGWILCKYSVYIYVNGKMRPVETIVRIQKG